MNRSRRKGPGESHHDTARAKGSSFAPKPRRAGARRQSHRNAGAAYRPRGQALSRRQDAVLAELRWCGSKGVTRLEAPAALILSFSQRVAELRGMGFRIDSKREAAGDARVARYTLRAVPEASR